SAAVSTQAPEHKVRPGAHWHDPLGQVAPELHAFPHDPQWFGSDESTTQLPPHAGVPAGPVPTPPLPGWPPPPALPQGPPGFVSLARFTHAPEQFVRPPPQAPVQVPAEQTSPATQACPQPPQLFTSELVLTHAWGPRLT